MHDDFVVHMLLIVMSSVARSDPVDTVMPQANLAQGAPISQGNGRLPGTSYVASFVIVTGVMTIVY